MYKSDRVKKMIAETIKDLEAKGIKKPYINNNFYCETCGNKGKCNPESSMCFICGDDNWKLVEPVEVIDDLSYSNLVSLIQGDGIKAADVLHSIAIEMEENNKLIEELENKLLQAENRKYTLLAGTQKVMQHIKKEYPLAVKRKDYIVVVTKENISIERNVL